MHTPLTKKQIGKRIVALRKIKGLSQDDLAKKINMSRPSLAQIELGNRGIDILEFQKLGFELAFSLDDFMSKNFTTNLEKISKNEVISLQAEERISEPTLNIQKFKNVLLYMLERCAGKPNVGETVLYKLLYFADFNYYELYEEHLTGVTYRKLPFGPVPQKLDIIIAQMIEDGQLERIKTPYFNKIQTRYIPIINADLKSFNGAEIEVIDKVLEQYSDWSAVAISDYSHKDLPWLVSKDGEDISYNLAFYREFPYSVRIYDESENIDSGDDF
jgi:transcriptional regulator with XRE-family HTH domain